MPLDMFEEASGRMRSGPANPPISAQPVPKADMMDEAFARLRPDVVTSQIAPPTRENPRGHVLESPGWGMGASILNGMALGYLPELYAGATAKPFVQTNPAEQAQAQADYTRRLAEIQASKQNYAENNSGKNLVGEVGGSMATAIPAMAAGGAGLSALAGPAVRAAPWLSGVTDFLSGASKARALAPASMAVRGGLEGGAAAGLTSHLSETPFGEQMKTGSLIGMLLGPAGALTQRALGSHVNKTTAESAQALIDAGVPIRAGQIPGSNKVAQGLDKVFGGGNAAQREQFAEKLTEHAGAPTKEINQGWVAKNDQRIGTTMNNIQSVYSIPALEPGLLSDLSAIRSKGLSDFSLENAKKIDNFVRQVEENVYNPMSGATYKNLTQKGGLLDNMGKDKDIASIVPKFREALDDAWGRSLPADKKAAWDQARKEYKITRVIDDSMGASGAAEGVYNPKKLLKAVEDRFGNVENAGDLGKLARGGQFLEPPGVAPASAKHGPMKTIGTLALGGAAATAASEGSRALTHWGPEAIAALSQHPENFALPMALAGGLYGGARMANSALNSPRATQYLLDVSRGSRQPLLQGNNPLIPMMVEGYNRQ